MNVDITRFDIGAVEPLWLEERAEIDIIVPPEARITAPLSVLHLHGSLDGSTYDSLVSIAQQELTAGIRQIVIDLENAQSISNAGIVGLYMVAALLGGKSLDKLEGHEIVHQMRRAIEMEERCPGLILAAPAEGMSRALASCGLEHIVSILPSVNEAISAFPEDWTIGEDTALL